MSFIEELMKSQGTDALGITYEKPKADENINKLISDNELSPKIQEVIQTAIMGGVGGPAGSLKGLTQLIKRKGGKETLKKINLNKKEYERYAKNVVKFIEDINKKSIKNLSKEEGTKGFSMKVTDNLLPIIPKYTRGVPAVIPKRNPHYGYYPREVSTRSNILPILSLLATGGLAGYTANKATKEYNLDNILSKMLRPDPSMPTKQQNDEDMNLMKMLMSPETQLKSLKNTGQGYPADEEMFLRSETENTNEMLLKLLGQ